MVFSSQKMEGRNRAVKDADVRDSSRFSCQGHVVETSKNRVQSKCTGCKYSIIIFYFRFLFCFYKSLMSIIVKSLGEF